MPDKEGTLDKAREAAKAELAEDLIEPEPTRTIPAGWKKLWPFPGMKIAHVYSDDLVPLELFTKAFRSTNPDVRVIDFTTALEGVVPLDVTKENILDCIQHFEDTFAGSKVLDCSGEGGLEAAFRVMYMAAQRGLDVLLVGLEKAKSREEGFAAEQRAWCIYLPHLRALMSRTGTVVVVTEQRDKGKSLSGMAMKYLSDTRILLAPAEDQGVTVKYEKCRHPALSVTEIAIHPEDLLPPNDSSKTPS